MPKRRRGHPVAVLVGLEKGEAHIWDVFSESVKPGPQITVSGTDYGFHEAIVDQLRPRLKEGVKTMLVATEDRGLYNAFMGHLGRHHGWLLRGWELNTVTLIHIQGRARTAEEVRTLAASDEFRSRLSEASEGDLVKVMGVLEKRLNTSEGIDTLMLSLDDVEAGVYGEESPEYILVTDEFTRRHRGRAQRLLQVAQIVRPDFSAPLLNEVTAIARLEGTIAAISESLAQELPQNLIETDVRELARWAAPREPCQAQGNPRSHMSEAVRRVIYGVLGCLTVVLAATSTIGPADLPIRVTVGPRVPRSHSLADVEREHVLATLESTDWNVSRSATILGVDRSTLYAKIKKYGLERQPHGS